MMMNHIRRVFSAIRHRPGNDIPTGELTMDRPFMESLLAWKGDRSAREKMTGIQMRIACARILNHDLICLPVNPVGAHDWNSTPPYSELTRAAKEGLFVFWIVDGAFQRAMTRRDFMEFMETIALRPEDVAEELEQLSRETEAGIIKGVDNGASGILIADDIAYQKSTYVSPAFGERFLVPIWRQQTAAARSAGVPVFFHADGNINRFLPLIVESGFDGLQGIEPAAGMDIFEVKRAYGTDLCLMGNIDPSLLHKPNRSAIQDDACRDLDRAVTDLIAKIGGSGGLILGSCSGLYQGMSPQRVCHMAEFVHRRQPPL
jgi:uroporphyrinogen decarboxylase